MIPNATILRVTLLAATLTLVSSAAVAQSGLITSRNADFSTVDQQFEPGQTVYVGVRAPEIDATDIDESELRLRPAAGGDGFETTLENNFDGSYKGRIELPQGGDAIGKWLLEVRLKDGMGHAFEARASLSVGSGFDAQEFKVEGIVTEVGDSFIAVAGRKILVTSDTEIVDNSDQRLRLNDIQVGDRVHVAGIVREGVPVAVRILAMGHHENEVEFTGVIEDVRDHAIVMFGRVLEVTDATEILNSEGRSIPFSSLEKGMMASARARLEMDRIVLLRIKVRTGDSREFEVKGSVTELRDRGFALDGHFIFVTEETEFFGPGDRHGEFSDLHVGDFVNVEGFINEDSVPIARRVEIADRPGPREFQVAGPIREIGDRALVVAGLKILVTADTRILGKDGEPVEFGTLMRGDYVDIRGFVGDDGSLIARLIVVGDADRQEIAVSGKVQRKGGNVLVVEHIPFEVTDRTEIFDEKGDPFPFSEIEVGTFVRIKGLLFPATRTAIALKIEVRTRRFVHLTGTINEIGDGAISVSGIRVFVNHETVITGAHGEPLEFADLKIGQIVKVEGWRTDGGVLARSIRVRIRVEDEVLATGILEAVHDSVVVVLGVEFRVLAGTGIVDADGQELSLRALEVGRPIRVRGKLLADGTLIALSIRELDHRVRGIHVVGPIESIGTATIEVIGIHFFVDGSTEILGTAGRPLRLQDLQVGQTVALQGVGQPDGTRLAVKIRLLDVLVALGDVNVLSTDRVQMFGVDFATETDMLVLRDGIHATTLSSSSDETATAEIRAATDESGEMRISKMTLYQDSGSTVVTVDDGETVPSKFDLRQNYPNPFNPATTITLQVFESGAVDLAVYNVLGQRIATLTDGTLAPGLYTFEWDGRDTSGTPAASGLYLYRAVVGGTVQARTMTLLK